MYLENNDQNESLISIYNEFIIKNVEDMFNKVDSAHKQRSIYMQNNEVVMGNKIHIGSKFKADNKKNLVEKKYFGYSIPMLPSLKNLLKSLPEKLVEPIVNEKIKTNVFDGERIKTKMKRKNTLAFALYLDDMELVNVCGSGTKIHKQSKFEHKIFFKTY